MTRILSGALFGAVRLLTGTAISGSAPSGPTPAIYYANHASHLDTLVLLASLPAARRARTHPVAARDYWGAARLRRFVAIDCLGAVLIDRNPQPGADVLAPVVALLERGHSIVFFPEGTRSQGELGSFRSGLYRLAVRCPLADLVPVHLGNVHRVLPKGSRLPVPLICTARFGRTLARDPAEMPADFLGRARAALLALAGSGGSRQGVAA